MPSERVRQLERLLARIRHAGSVLLNYDMWDRWGSANATADERAAMDAEAAEATRQQVAVRAELEALVIATRADAPAEVVAWADAHDAYLAAFIDECAAQGERADTAAFVAKQERAAWQDVRAGKRPFVDENCYYVRIDSDRYRALFGIDPQTLVQI